MVNVYIFVYVARLRSCCGLVFFLHRKQSIVMRARRVDWWKRLARLQIAFWRLIANRGKYNLS